MFLDVALFAGAVNLLQVLMLVFILPWIGDEGDRLLKSVCISSSRMDRSAAVNPPGRLAGNGTRGSGVSRTAF